MAFLLPYFEYDVFVSYSHGVQGNESDAPLRDWTLYLIRRLETDIRAVDTEFDDLHIWRDEQIDPTIHVSDELRGKVKSSGILLIVMSPRYLTSAWCKDELEWFRQQVQDRERDHGRVFLVRVLRTDENRWPDFLRDARGHSLPGFQFHDKQDSMPFGWRGSGENREAYVRELWRLQTALTRRLRELLANAARRVKPQVVRNIGDGSSQRRIYLHARPENASAYDEVKRALLLDGMARSARWLIPGATSPIGCERAVRESFVRPARSPRANTAWTPESQSQSHGGRTRTNRRKLPSKAPPSRKQGPRQRRAPQSKRLAAATAAQPPA
jgi:hypothetical protein